MRWLLILILTTPAAAYAASSKMAGTSGAQFLRMGAGARSTAMGDAFVGVSDDVNAAYFNPAGLAYLDRPELVAMHTQWIQGLNYDYGSFVQPTDAGAFAFTVATLKTDDLTRRGNDESDLGTFDNQDSSYGISYGRMLTETLSTGLTGRWIRSSIAGTSAQTFSGDLGVYKRFDNRPFTLGFAARNIGGKLKFNEEGDPLPLTIDAGAGLHLMSDRLLLSGNVKHVRDTGIKFGVGSEWRMSLRDKFRCALRAGFNNTAVDTNGASGLSIGAGAGYKKFTLDFAWVPFGDLGNTFRYAAHFKF